MSGEMVGKMDGGRVVESQECTLRNRCFCNPRSRQKVPSGLTSWDSVLEDDSGGKGDWTIQQLEAERPVGRLFLFFRKEMRALSRPVAKEINERRGEISVSSID